MAVIVRRLAAAPVEATVTRRAGPPANVLMHAGDFAYAVRGILYEAGTALRLPDMLGRAVSSGSLDEFAQRYFDREVRFEATLAHGLHFSVLCSEDVPFPAERDIVEATKGTFMGRYLFDEYRHACAQWPRAPIRSDARTPVTARVPTLLVSGWLDPSTPPQFAERVARSLPVSRLLVSTASAHGSLQGCAGAAAAHVLATTSLAGVPEVCR
jgi:pimeloyl-ACP methyl ester carboxylesterase